MAPARPSANQGTWRTMAFGGLGRVQGYYKAMAPTVENQMQAEHETEMETRVEMVVGENVLFPKWPYWKTISPMFSVVCPHSPHRNRNRR